MSKRSRRTFTEEFKTQIVNLYLSGKKKSEILREYDLHAVVGNELDREFNDRDRLEAIVSDLTYVRALSLALYLHHHGLV